jgi:hypothetical protein
VLQMRPILLARDKVALAEFVEQFASFCGRGQSTCGVRVVSVEQWRQYAYRRGISATDTTPRAQQRAFQRAVDQLVGSNRVAVWDDQVWTT